MSTYECAGRAPDRWPADPEGPNGRPGTFRERRVGAAGLNEMRARAQGSTAAAGQ